MLEVSGFTLLQQHYRDRNHWTLEIGRAPSTTSAVNRSAAGISIRCASMRISPQEFASARWSTRSRCSDSRDAAPGTVGGISHSSTSHESASSASPCGSHCRAVIPDLTCSRACIGRSPVESDFASAQVHQRVRSPIDTLTSGRADRNSSSGFPEISVPKRYKSFSAVISLRSVKALFEI